MVTKKQKEKWSTCAKRYLASAGITFITAFVGAILLADIDLTTIESFKSSLSFAVVASAARVGVKAVWELMRAWIAKYQ